MRFRKRYLLVPLCVLISAFFLWLFLKGTDWAELGRNLITATPGWVALAILCVPILYVVRAYRWRIFVGSAGKVPVRGLFSATCIGFMANNVLPGRVGELIRAGVLKVRWRLPLSTAVATVIVERVFDMISLGFFIALILIIPPGRAAVTNARLLGDATVSQTAFSLQDLRMWGGVVAVITGIVVLFFILLRAYPRFIRAVASVPLRLMPRPLARIAEKMLDGIEAGLMFLRSFRQTALAAAFSLAIWALAAMSMYSSCRAVQVRIGAMGACLTFVCVALAVALPQAPGYVGVYHWAFVVSLAYMQVPDTLGKASAIISHAAAVVPVTIMGLVCLWWEGLSLAQLYTSAEREKQAESLPSET